MKTKELREKSTEELQKELQRLLRNMFKYRTQKAMSQITQFKQTHLLKQDRRNIARIRTILTEQSKV
ncbi:MAG: 50S ribosomal protein L29 [Endozoicomonadaceae bacterium]|nr:50S ribosomal protein L29 [Endozoicomonadaceae bacterium]MCY4330739.1 50S ribosomal protein L29 [Endozoicomonadaceae bacterium]